MNEPKSGSIWLDSLLYTLVGLLRYEVQKCGWRVFSHETSADFVSTVSALRKEGWVTEKKVSYIISPPNNLK